MDSEKQGRQNECVICHEKEFTAGEPMKQFVCDSCMNKHAITEQMEDEMGLLE